MMVKRMISLQNGLLTMTEIQLNVDFFNND